MTEENWNRVHPVSPFVRGWVLVAGAIYIYVQNVLNSAIDGHVNSNIFALPTEVLWPVVGIAAALLTVIVGGFYLSWRFTQYQVTDEHVRVRTGVLFRQNRQARIDRVQAIDIVQPLLARIFGLAELKFEVADSGDSAMSLSYLKYKDAQALRSAILTRAAGLRNQTTTPAPSPDATLAANETGAASSYSLENPLTEPVPETVVATTPVGRLIGSSLLNSTLLTVVGAIAVPFIVAGVWLNEPITLVALVPAGLSAGALLWSELNKGFAFTASSTPDGLRLKYGLTDTSHQTIPPGRIQAIRVESPWLWRLFGWHRITANVAGYGLDNAVQRSVLLRVGTLDDVYAVLPIVLPDPGTENPRAVLEKGLQEVPAEDGSDFTQTPRRAAWLSPLTYKRQGYLSTDTSIVIRGGRLNRHVTYVPHERTQGVLLQQGPIARRVGVADVELASTMGMVRARVKQMDVKDARHLFLMQADKAATARRLHDRNLWLIEEQHHE
ncbi:PH domain-containing protein [Neomicrococcus aestuarii]|uniref:YdbS-like PH domain-containing protein n=1 Tax=Neomicrococcus aestuarii TaxID=556325 RepID=A0A1L2ZP18_9MICC|nr:PH domain-containing protein [Neomicrococcus aestuarii]APF40920.1 hypothetical protein BHE16_07755 [Neomicrococcus aestuarii]